MLTDCERVDGLVRRGTMKREAFQKRPSNEVRLEISVSKTTQDDLETEVGVEAVQTRCVRG